MTATASPVTSAPSQASVMAQAAEENFPVAARILGARRREQLLAIYGFARLVDDIGDEADGDRRALLDWVQGDLERIYAHEEPEHEVLRTLRPAITELTLPSGPFLRLIEANRRDQDVTRYATFAELLDYCQLSAAPVGELVLHIFGAATPERIALSDRVCAGLQVVEHLQDVAEDFAMGRVYLPAEDQARFGVTDADIAAAHAGPAFTRLIAFESARAAELLTGGAPLIRRLEPRAALAVAAFVAGGRAALAALADGGYDVLGARLRPSKATVARTLLRTLGARS